MLNGSQGSPLGFNIFEAFFHIPGLRDKILIPTANSLVLQAYLLLESKFCPGIPGYGKALQKY